VTVCYEISLVKLQTGARAAERAPFSRRDIRDLLHPKRRCWDLTSLLIFGKCGTVPVSAKSVDYYIKMKDGGDESPRPSC